MSESRPTRLLIFGSCVSRDILNYQQDDAQLVLVDYYARCSLASLGSRPINMPSTVQIIDSKFQKRMVERDIRKDFLNDLAGFQFDVLLLDLIDERFNLYLEPQGKVCTLSSELLSSGFPGDSDGGSMISTGSEEFWRLWEAGWLVLVNKLRVLRVLDRLLINQVFWGTRTENGGNFEPHYPVRYIDTANQFLDRMYRRISGDIPYEQFLRFDYRLMTGSITHTWGISPFHYVDGYYHSAIQQLVAWPSRKKLISASRVAMPAVRTTYSTKQVLLKHEREDLVATVASDATRTGQFAFYVFRNGKRIHTQGYSSNPAMRFRIQREPGLYQVLVFFLSPNGSRSTKYSNPVFLYSAAHTPAFISHDGLSRNR
jgi:Family of unknown function (DUF6270)